MCEGVLVVDHPLLYPASGRPVSGTPSGGLRIAVLVKQVPNIEVMALDPNGRLQREGIELEMNPYCRRAVSKGVELARLTVGTCTVVTMGPEAAEDCLREAIAWGADAGLLLTDPAFAGSDTLATARALAAVLRSEGPFDLVLVGRNSVDADTGQVGPQVAELLDLPFAHSVRELTLLGSGNGLRLARVVCEHEAGRLTATVRLPAVLSVAERLCEPCKVEPAGRRAVDARNIRRVAAASCGLGPWGQAGSPTRVGEVRVLEASRLCRRLGGSIDDQAREAVEILQLRGVLDSDSGNHPFVDGEDPLTVPNGRVSAGNRRLDEGGALIAVMVEPGRPRIVRELLGEAAVLAQAIEGDVVALATEEAMHGLGADSMSTWGADSVIVFRGSDKTECVGRGMAAWADRVQPWAILAPSTAWGRELAARVAARVGAGLTGDAIALEYQASSGSRGRLVAWKPALGGQFHAAVTASSPIQMATVRAGVLQVKKSRKVRAVPVIVRSLVDRGRMQVDERTSDDDPDVLAHAAIVVGVGMGVELAEYPRLQPLVDALGGELAGTRKVTDRGWLPHSRQVGITGCNIAPRLYVAVGISGKMTHLLGVRSAGTVLAINNDPMALVFRGADIGIVGDWRDVVPKVIGELEAYRAVRRTAPHGA